MSIKRVQARVAGTVVGVLAVSATLAAPTAALTEHEDQVLMFGNNPAGSQSVSAQRGNSFRAEYTVSDRARGDHIIATWKLDSAGVPTEYLGNGNDYMKAAVTESFHKSGDKASWRNRSEQGEKSVPGEAFYVPNNAPPEFMGVLARALLMAPGHKLPLLPAGEAQITAAGSTSLPGPGGAAVALSLYQITGLDFSPIPVWLDQHGNTAAALQSWYFVLPTGYLPFVDRLREAQAAANNAWQAALAKQQAHVPSGELLIRNARLFDPRDLSVTAGMSVLIRGQHIVRVAKEAEMKAANDAEVIDAAGRFLMPGLWDNHQHFDNNDGALDLANGVTSARDMGNNTDEFLQRVARFDAGTELGPHVFKAGLIDGKDPLHAPVKMLVATRQESIEDVTWYAEHGYGQIKIYSSVKPELVPIIADEAHARGLRVSGHVPAFMSAQQFVEAGADEIQHLNFIVLNFLFDTVKDTRDMTRFTAVGEHAREIIPDKPQVREFINLLKAHHTVLDPTVNLYESDFLGDPAAVTPGIKDIVPRFPPQVRRAQLSGALIVPKGKEDAYREAFPAMLRLLKGLYDAGIPIVPGTDAISGYMLPHELELYVRAGIAPREVLRMATLTSAQTSGVDRERGVIAPGKLADVILVDGDPSTRITDLRKLVLVIKAGCVYDPAKIEASLGITPRG